MIFRSCARRGLGRAGVRAVLAGVLGWASLTGAALCQTTQPQPQPPPQVQYLAPPTSSVAPASSPAASVANTSSATSNPAATAGVQPVAPTNSTQPTTVVGPSGVQQTPPTLLQYQAAGLRPPPFGAELFSNSNVTASLNILDPGYIIEPGDHITLAEYGGLPDQAVDAVVDPKGNILVPGVGPVKVQGLPASAVNTVVQTAAKAVFSSAVGIYATPTTTAPITVFVTGPVRNPGPFSGASTDSVIAYLQRSGGVDPMRGSYRNIVVRRDGQVIYRLDLYAFLRTGELPPVRLRQNDVIVVGQQGSIVSVYAGARAPFTFELAQPTGEGEELLYYARPEPETNYAALLGTRDAKPFNIYLPLGQFAKTPLLDGDRVQFNADAIGETVVVQVEGAHLGASAYVVPRQTSLGAVLAQIPLDPMADRQWIHLKRVSAAIAQKALLNESLSRLEKAIYTQSSYTATEAQANQAQAQTIQQYINLASQVQPEGDVALPVGANLDQVELEPDDTIVIPFKTQVVAIAGEVNEPQGLIYEPGAPIASYVRRAGGFTDTANKGHILVIHPDGTTQVGGRVEPGDRILVLTHLTGKFLELMKDLTQILYQVAIAGYVASKG